MSGQQSRSSKCIQGIAASPPRPLVTRRTTSQSEREEKEHTAPRTEAGENLEKITAEGDARPVIKKQQEAQTQHDQKQHRNTTPKPTVTKEETAVLQTRARQTVRRRGRQRPTRRPQEDRHTKKVTGRAKDPDHPCLGTRQTSQDTHEEIRTSRPHRERVRTKSSTTKIYSPQYETQNP
jgi:hypothetical protein